MEQKLVSVLVILVKAQSLNRPTAPSTLTVRRSVSARDRRVGPTRGRWLLQLRENPSTLSLSSSVPLLFLLTFP